jgi:hypothetical protein
MRVSAQKSFDSVVNVPSNVSERKEMTVNSRCNYTGLFSKRIPTRSIASLFARLSWFSRR